MLLVIIIIGLIAINLTVFGILLPFLISYSSNLLVLIGLLIGIIMLLLDYAVIPKIYKKIKERVE